MKLGSGENFFIMDNHPLLQDFLAKGIKVSSEKIGTESLSFCLQVVAKPGAKRTSITLSEQGALKVTLRERPVEGAANKGVTELLCERLGLPSRQITLISGDKSKQKRFQLLFLFTAHKGVPYYREKLLQLLD